LKVLDTFLTFFKLGLISFGGPVAHLAYFQNEFVEKRKLLSEQSYMDLVSFCQFLPGPASSQVAMAIGLQRASYLGLLASWIGFTLPSSLVMLSFAYGMLQYGDVLGSGWIHGVKAAVVGVVGYAVLKMAKAHAPDLKRIAIVLMATIIPHLILSAWGQVLSIFLGALAGLLFLENETKHLQMGAKTDETPSINVAVASIALFIFCLSVIALPTLSAMYESHSILLFDRFYRVGSLVFGGGHVVLPLLKAELVHTGFIPTEIFLAGYGIVQAMPGPLFSLASYLGAVAQTELHLVWGSFIALFAIFLPSSLMIIGGLPFWNLLRKRRLVRRPLIGINAAVVGLLIAAFYDPVLVEGITGITTGIIAVVSFILLAILKVPAWSIVIFGSIAGAVVL